MKNPLPVLLSSLAFLPCAMPSASAASAQEIAATVTHYLQERTREAPGMVAISVTPIDPRQQALAGCGQLQAFLPQGQKAWGRVTVGVRCMTGANASVYVSAKVKVDGRYVKLARSVPGGQLLSESDLSMEEGELTAYPDDVVLTSREAVGQTTRQALSAGQALRSSYLKDENSIQAGQSVSIVARGGGFSVVNHGKALNSAARGGLTRVKLENGQIVSGIATEPGVVDVSGRR